MAKIKEPDAAAATPDTPQKHPRKPGKSHTQSARPEDSQPESKTTRIPQGATSTPTKSKLAAKTSSTNGELGTTSSLTPKPNGKSLFATPKKNETIPKQTPSKSKRADQSAKRKSAHALAEMQEEDDWDGQNELAQEILDEGQEKEVNGVLPSRETGEGDEAKITTPAATPSKRGRPKGSKNKRSPTPEGDLPPEERYFYQNRAGPPQVSSSTLSSVNLLTHDEFFEQMRVYKDHHEPDKAYLMKLHARSFPQWKFEMSEGFNICLYGYGSKRRLVNKFADWLYAHSGPTPRIVVVNGYTTKLSVRSILTTIASTLVGENEEMKLVGQPQEMLDTLISHLDENPPSGQLVVIINSIDAASLRRASTQTLLARLANHALINVVATADSPTCALLWNSTLLDEFNFAFHDATTFVPYDAEIGVVDEVHELLGRKGRRMGGKEGIGFVLKSLPENARNLYRVLLTEILSVLTDGIDGPMDEGVDLDDATAVKPSRDTADEVGIEYRALYQRASEEFICSSDMNFRFLLKEFHDHQMITSRRDGSGTELFGIPLGKEEMEGVLEDLGGT